MFFSLSLSLFTFAMIRSRYSSVVCPFTKSIKPVLTTNSKAAIDNWIEHNIVGNNISAIGLDVEWPSSLYKIVTDQRVATIQLGCNQGVLIAQLRHLHGHSTGLSWLLTSSNVLKVGVDIERDLVKLERDFGFKYENFCDLKKLSKKVYNSTKLGLASLARLTYNVELEKKKSIQVSDWGAIELSDAQITYAAIDSLASWAIYEKLVNKLEVPPS